MAAIVFVTLIVAGPLIVAVHVHGNATVGVIERRRDRKACPSPMPFR